MTDPQEVFPQALQRYRDAVHARDVAALVSLYDEDVAIFDTWGAWSLRGREAWRTLVADWFGSLGEERVAVGFDQPGSVDTAELVIGHVFVTFAAFSPQGERLRWLTNRMTLALRRQGEDWKIVHEHTSVPIEHATLKGILQRG